MKLLTRLALLTVLALFLAALIQGRVLANQELLDKGIESLRKSRRSEGISLIRQAVESFREKGDKKGEADALWWLGMGYQVSGEFKEAEGLLQQSFVIAKSSDDKQSMAMALVSIGDNFRLLGDNEKARGYYERTLTMKGAVHESLIAQSFSALGLITFTKEGAEQARPLMEEAFTLIDKPEILQWHPLFRHKAAVVCCDFGSFFAGTGDYEKAQKAFSAQIKLARSVKDRDLEAKGLVHLGGMLKSTGDLSGALSKYYEALEIMKQEKNKAGEAIIENHLGSICQARGDYDGALAHYQRALLINKAAGNKESECISLIDIGSVYKVRGELQEALRCFEDAKKLVSPSGSDAQEVLLNINSGAVYQGLLRFEDALKSYEEALKKVRKTGDRVRESVVLSNIGVVYEDLSDHEKALEYFTRSHEIAGSLGNKALQADAFLKMGDMYLAKGNDAKASEMLEKAQEYAKDCDALTAAIALNNIGFMKYSQALRSREAWHFSAALEKYQEALKRAQAMKLAPLEGTLLGNIALIHEEKGEFSEARGFYDKALAKKKAAGDIKGEAFVYASLGFLSHKENNREEAIRSLMSSVECIEKALSAIHTEPYREAFARDWYHVYYLLIELLMDDHRYDEAFVYNERSRSMGFLSTMVSLSLPMPERIQAQEQELVKKEESLRQAIAYFVSKAIKTGLDDGERARVARIENDYREVQAILAGEAPEYSSLTAISGVSPAVVQKAIPPDTVLLEYFMAQDKVFVWALSDKAVEYAEVPCGVSSLYEKITDARGLLYSRGARGEGWRKSAGDLYRLLIGPVKEVLKGKKNIVILSHRALNYLPFAVLLSPEGRLLVEEYSIGYAPSAAVWKICAAKEMPRTGTFVGFALGGKTRSGIMPLPGTEKEVQKAASLFPGSLVFCGQDFTLDSVKEASPRGRIVHFATHGRVDGNHPLASALVTSESFLTTAEVFHLKLSAQLVTLSGCDTALLKDSPGNDLEGLVRAFMYAGTPAVVATLWPIHDEETASLMEDFYGSLKGGATSADALRHAQCAAIKENLHPGKWAPFIIMGK
ncbi:MAG: CHAT domain-containing protein [Candidatus Eremiobacteraeota bacterium]|nr:CHAT domain-containing protein [Candidatus Eremiobacteraeota bacterium]